MPVADAKVGIVPRPAGVVAVGRLFEAGFNHAVGDAHIKVRRDVRWAGERPDAAGAGVGAERAGDKHSRVGAVVEIPGEIVPVTWQTADVVAAGLVGGWAEEGGLHERLVWPWKRLDVATWKARRVVIAFAPAEIEDLDGELASATCYEPLRTVGHEGVGGQPRVDVVLIDGVKGRGSAKILESRWDVRSVNSAWIAEVPYLIVPSLHELRRRLVPPLAPEGRLTGSSELSATVR